MAAMLCITASAAESEAVIRVSGLKKDGETLEEIGSYTVFEDGWNYAVKFAENGQRMNDNEYVRIVVDVLDIGTPMTASSIRVS